MKTLDETIFEAPYTMTPWEENAIYYLKEYRELQKEVEKQKEMIEFLEKPLTWDELRQMEGMPVWVEEENQPSQWYLIGDVETDEDDYPEFASMIVYDCQGDYLFYKYNIGTTWQAYRKERNER